MTAHTGQCLCGEIKYEITGDPVAAGVCHCTNCQHQTGSAFSTLAGVPRDALTFTAGEPKCYHDTNTDSGSPVERYFCGNCGSPIYSAVAVQPDVVYVKAGTLDEADKFVPQFHIWCRSKQGWFDIPEGVPTRDKQS